MGGYDASSSVGRETPMVRVLEEVPYLGEHLSDAALPHARAAAIAPLIEVAAGVTPFLIEETGARGHLGLLVLSGLTARHVTFGEIGSTEFVGPGDLFNPWRVPSHPAEAVEVHWEVLAPSRLAALDYEFASRIRAWPGITASLLSRSAARADAQVLQAALHQAKHVEDRVLLALWHFAGRWGEACPEGRIVSLSNITGELLARFVGTRRQSASTALGKLADRGAVRRRPDGSLLLPHAPPELKARRA